jgi:hypothetical protein
VGWTKSPCFPHLGKTAGRDVRSISGTQGGFVEYNQSFTSNVTIYLEMEVSLKYD